jgi:hypothetical protein
MTYMTQPEYKIYTTNGEEYVNTNFFDEIESEVIWHDTPDNPKLRVAFISLKNNKSFWLNESEWILIKRQLNLNKILDE